MKISHENALELLAKAAQEGHPQSIIAYERAMWRLERDADINSKANKGKVSRAQGVLEDVLE